jgi:hypothetical protein
MVSVLGLEAAGGARLPTKAALKKAYRKRLLQCHPDKCPDAQQPAEEAFKLVTRAMEVMETGGEVAAAFLRARHERTAVAEAAAAAAAAARDELQRAAGAAASAAAATAGGGGFFSSFKETAQPRSMFGGFSWAQQTDGLGYHKLSEATRPQDVAGGIKCAFCPTRFMYHMQDHYIIQQRKPCVFTCVSCKRGNVVHSQPPPAAAATTPAPAPAPAPRPSPAAGSSAAEKFHSAPPPWFSRPTAAPAAATAATASAPAAAAAAPPPPPVDEAMDVDQTRKARVAPGVRARRAAVAATAAKAATATKRKATVHEQTDAAAGKRSRAQPPPVASMWEPSSASPAASSAASAAASAAAAADGVKRKGGVEKEDAATAKRRRIEAGVCLAGDEMRFSSVQCSDGSLQD